MHGDRWMTWGADLDVALIGQPTACSSTRCSVRPLVPSPWTSLGDGRLAHTLTVSRTARWWTSHPPDGVALRGTLYVLHGYGQLPAFFIRKFQAQVNAGWRVVAPEGAHRFYLKGTDGRVGASWMTREARLDDIEDQTHFLDALRAQLDAESNTGSGAGLRVLLGFSQGASTALRWAHSARAVRPAGTGSSPTAA